MLKNTSINRDFRRNASRNVTKLIDYEEFKCRSKVGVSGVFSRNRNLTFKDLIVIISRGLKNSLQRELDSFYKEVESADFNIRKVTKGAFSQARAKLNHTAFIEMNDNVNETFYKDAQYYSWAGHRLLAVDGSRIILPNHPSIKEEFGEHGFGPHADCNRSMAVISTLFDVLNLLTVDAQIDSLSVSEQELLTRHLEKLMRDDLVLLDRGYPSIELMFRLIAQNVHFCMRMKESWWLPIREFTESGKKEMNVTFELPEKSNHLLEEYPNLKTRKITCRLIRVTLETGESEILCTTLLDRKKYPHSDFKGLYHLRWNIEENYKLLKSRAELESFSGKTAHAVKQDFFAKIFSMTYCAVLAFPIAEKVAEESRLASNKYEQRINRTNALSMVKNILIGVFLKNKIQSAIEAFDKIVSNTKELLRPNRKHPRNKKPKRLYHMNYKPF